MGRALKIAKTSPGSGNSGASVNVDVGFPSFDSLTNPSYGSGTTLSATEYLGVVGGSSTDSTPSATNPQIAIVANVALADGTYTGYGAGRIVRQKGSHKFLVCYSASSTSAGSFIVGQAYKILSPGNTDWGSIGHGDGNAAAGDEFTATGAGSGTGTALPIGQCVLSNTATPAKGYMSISYSVGDSSAVYASYITNKWVRDWNGMTYGNYSDSNYGTNVTSGENFYPTNFFGDEGNVTWSGAEIINGSQAQNGSLQLAQIASVTTN